MIATPSRPSVVMLIGQVLDDRYQIMSLLGEGATGAVYRAEQPEGPPVAVKVLHEDLGDDAELRARFEREAAALFGLQHPNILKVYDFGIVNRSPYLVMELLDGMPLDQYIEEHEPGPDVALMLGRQILEGLTFAHQQGALHRDLKTENVYVARAADGSLQAKLLDFGLVKFIDDDRWGSSKKLTMQGAVFGTPAYMSPEQCSGAPTTAATDVYATGVMLFELLTGLWPFMEETRMEMFRAHLLTPPPRLEESREGLRVRPELQAVLDRALSKLSADRFPDAAAMLAALDAVPSPAAWLEAGPGEPARAAGARGGARSMRLVLGLLILLVIALGVGAAMLLR